MNHTKEPWRVELPDGSMGQFDAIHGVDDHVCTTWDNYNDGPGVCTENARRIVACVNACAEFSTETLEGRKTPGFWGGLSARLIGERNAAQAQCAQLLSALMQVADCPSEFEPRVIARKAIAALEQTKNVT